VACHLKPVQPAARTRLLVGNLGSVDHSSRVDPRVMTWNGGSVTGPVTRNLRMTSAPSETPRSLAIRGSVSFSGRAVGGTW
jgi:hypothetical protein